MLTAILGRKNSVLVVYFRHSLQDIDLCSQCYSDGVGHVDTRVYIGSTVCCITHSVQMYYKQCGLVDHNVVEKVKHNPDFVFFLFFISANRHPK